MTFTVLAFLVAMLVQATGPQRNADLERIGQRDINRGNINFISPDREVELGRALRSELERTANVLVQPEVSAYVDSLVQLLRANSDATRPIVSAVIDSDEPDVFALPGGALYVTTGLIRAAGSEAELAAALAHAVAHVAARHATEMMSRQELVRQAGIPLVGQPPNAPLLQAATTLVPANMAQFTRKNVLEADFLGLQYLFKAGYDADAAIRLLEKVQAGSAPASATLPATTAIDRYIGYPAAQTHPDPASRIDALRADRAKLPARAENRVTTPQFERIKALVTQAPR
jgi:predicted Zn-dependent protease